METFTVRELDRQPARIRDACDSEGAVRIRRRNGCTYTMRPETQRRNDISWKEWLAYRRKRLEDIFPAPVSRAQADELDRMIAGE